MTETIADIINYRLRRGSHNDDHRLTALADTPTKDMTPRPDVQRLDPNPALTLMSKPLAKSEVFVDDFVGMGQGNTERLRKIRNTFMHTIDQVLRPLDGQDSQYRREPISESKLKKGDACWETRKKVLGWILDTVSMTIELPPRRAQRLTDILQYSSEGRRICATRR